MKIRTKFALLTAGLIDCVMVLIATSVVGIQRVDGFDQTVSLQSAFTGGYQVRVPARDMGFSFDLSGISNKAITPNGDGLNDAVFFLYDNPRDSAVSGKIYDMKGGYIADMVPYKSTIGWDSLKWDGKSNGQVVSRGVYLYQIKAEDKTFTGTVVVIR